MTEPWNPSPADPGLHDRITAALKAAEVGVYDGAHHKMWVIDQMVRRLTGCPTETHWGTDVNGNPYSYETLGESDAYRAWVASFGDEDDPEYNHWDAGTAP